MFELIFLKILLQLSIFSLQTVPKCYSSNFQEQKDFDKKSRKATSTEKLLFCYTANPSKCQICKRSINEIKLTLLCETITYLNPSMAPGMLNTEVAGDNCTMLFQSFKEVAQKSCMRWHKPIGKDGLVYFCFSNIIALLLII